MLPLVPSVKPGQSLTGLCLQVAAAYGCSLREAAVLIGAVPAQHFTFAKGEADRHHIDSFGLQLNELARVSIRDSLGLPETTIDMLAVQHWAAGPPGFESPKGPWRRRGTAWCPECLAEDPWYLPTEWKLPGALACERHRRLLAKSCSGCGQRAYASRLAWRSWYPEAGVCGNRLGGLRCQAPLAVMATAPAGDDALFLHRQTLDLYLAEPSTPVAHARLLQALGKQGSRFGSRYRADQIPVRAALLSAVSGQAAPTDASVEALAVLSPWLRGPAQRRWLPGGADVAPALVIRRYGGTFRSTVPKRHTPPAWLPRLLPDRLVAEHLAFEELTADWWTVRRNATLLCWRVATDLRTDVIGIALGMSRHDSNGTARRLLKAFSDSGRLEDLEHAIDTVLRQLRHEALDYASRSGLKPDAGLLAAARAGLPLSHSLDDQTLASVLATEWLGDPDREHRRVVNDEALAADLQEFLPTLRFADLAPYLHEEAPDAAAC